MGIEEIEEAFFQYRSALFSFLRSLTGDSEMAEDIVQDCAIRVIEYHRKGKLVQRDTFKSFLYSIAYSRFKDLRRRSRKRPISYYSSEEEGELKSEDKSDLSERIYGVIYSVMQDGALPERQRMCLKFRLLEKFSVQEILDILKISRQTYYRDFESGLRVLRENLIREGLSPEDLS